MAFPFSLLMTWLGAALLWVAFHGTGATTPWGVYQELLGKGAAIPPTTGATGSDTSGGATNPDSTPGANPLSSTGYGGNDGDLLDQGVNAIAGGIASQFPQSAINPDGYTGSPNG
jgi:hypothetical protein